MSLSAFSPNNIIIAWAARVSFAQLGAGLSSYIETRASITTFRLAARYSSSAAFRRLPEELISAIVNQVSHQSFHDNVHEWLCIQDCLAGQCTLLSHFGRYCSRTDGRRCYMLGLRYPDDVMEQRHVYTAIHWGADLIRMDRSSKIAKYVRVSLISGFTQRLLEFISMPFFSFLSSSRHTS